MSVDNKILVATDLSARSDRPLERALLLRQQFGASLLVLHVLEDRKRLTVEEEQKLRVLLRDELNLAADGAEICFEYGSVPATVARVAQERGCALIVTGVARYNSPRDFVLGTAVDYLVQQSPVPVLVVKRRAHRPYGRLVVATDYSAASTKALVTAMRLFPAANVRLVHAYQAAFEAFLEHDTTAPLIRAEAEQKMAGIVAGLLDASKVETIVQEGQLANVVSQNVSEIGDDLLVLGTWHRRRHAHYMGSEDFWKLPASEPCDVLIVGKAAHEVAAGGHGVSSVETTTASE